jgi:hypothetical protein
MFRDLSTIFKLRIIKRHNELYTDLPTPREAYFSRTLTNANRYVSNVKLRMLKQCIMISVAGSIFHMQQTYF